MAHMHTHSNKCDTNKCPQCCWWLRADRPGRQELALVQAPKKQVSCPALVGMGPEVAFQGQGWKGGCHLTAVLSPACTLDSLGNVKPDHRILDSTPDQMNQDLGGGGVGVGAQGSVFFRASQRILMCSQG